MSDDKIKADWTTHPEVDHFDTYGLVRRALVRLAAEQHLAEYLLAGGGPHEYDRAEAESEARRLIAAAAS